MVHLRRGQSFFTNSERQTPYAAPRCGVRTLVKEPARKNENQHQTGVAKKILLAAPCGPVSVSKGLPKKKLFNNLRFRIKDVERSGLLINDGITDHTFLHSGHGGNLIHDVQHD